MTNYIRQNTRRSIAALSADEAKPSTLDTAQALEAARASVDAVTGAAIAAISPDDPAVATEPGMMNTLIAAGMAMAEAQARANALFTGQPPPSSFPIVPVAIGGALLLAYLLTRKRR